LDGGRSSIEQRNQQKEHSMNKLFRYSNILLSVILLAGVLILASGCDTGDQGNAPMTHEHHH
jgi:hypothetical protein